MENPVKNDIYQQPETLSSILASPTPVGEDPLYSALMGGKIGSIPLPPTLLSPTGKLNTLDESISDSLVVNLSTAMMYSTFTISLEKRLWANLGEGK